MNAVVKEVLEGALIKELSDLRTAKDLLREAHGVWREVYVEQKQRLVQWHESRVTAIQEELAQCHEAQGS